jgi:hypothetical protein
MVVAWMMSASASDVREMWDEYRERVQTLEPLADGGFVPRIRSPASLLRSIVLSEKKRMSGAEAQTELRHELATGHILATAYNLRDQQRVDLRPKDWLDLELYDDDRQRRVALRDKRSGILLYDDVQIDREAVLCAWPRLVEMNHPPIGSSLTGAVPEAIESGGQMVTRTAKRGRPVGSTRYKWPDFEREAIRRLKDEGGISLEYDPAFKQADLIRPH